MIKSTWDSEYPEEIPEKATVDLSQFLDLGLRVLALAVSLAGVALGLLKVISLESAVLLLGIGVIALALERLWEK